MINSHQFREAAKKFRAGRISLTEFNDFVFSKSELRNPNEAASKGKSANQRIDGLIKRLNRRPVDSHKGDFGRVIAIGGAEGMAGAISLTGVAALRSGSGLVKVAVPEMIQSLVAANNPCLMTLGCPADGDTFHGATEKALLHHCEWSDVVAIGPGMGRGGAQQWILKNLYAKIPQPMVVDADGLNALADGEVELNLHEGQRILTPHPGEFCRLVDRSITSRDELEVAAKELARSNGVIVVLKGNRTYVTDGEQDYQNQTGNPGMATAGSGDVLTGIITSLVGQGFHPLDASILGVHLHGTAGDLAAKKVGQVSLIATDLIDSLSVAIQALET
ncbi:MAG: NAD(P)H-hydrate dehydratase [Planctomycetota bacterium]